MIIEKEMGRNEMGQIELKGMKQDLEIVLSFGMQGSEME